MWNGKRSERCVTFYVENASLKKNSQKKENMQCFMVDLSPLVFIANPIEKEIRLW